MKKILFIAMAIISQKSLAVGVLSIPGLPVTAANTTLSNATNASAIPAGFVMPTCADTGGNHLNWVNGTGYTCGTSSGGSSTLAGLSDVSITSPLVGQLLAYNGSQWQNGQDVYSTRFSIAKTSAPTKKIAFDPVNQTAATTDTFNFPNAGGGSDTVATAGGTNTFAAVNTFSNTVKINAGLQASGGIGLATMTEGGTLTLDNSKWGYVLHAAAAKTAYTVKLPPAPADGELIVLGTDQTVTTLTIDGNGNNITYGGSASSTITITSVLGKGGIEFRFDGTTTNTWMPSVGSAFSVTPVASGGTGTTTSTGSGAVVLQTSPAFITPLLGTPTSGVATNLTGTASGLTAGTVTTNANLTGVITSSGNATSTGSQTGTGNVFAMQAAPHFTGLTLMGYSSDQGIGTSLQLNGSLYTNGYTYTTSYITTIGGISGVLATGQGEFGGAATDGAQLYGHGSTRDLSFFNNSGVLAAYVNTGTTNWSVSGNLNYTTNVPTVSACGTSPSVDSKASNNSGTVTVGTVAAASCTITFGTAYSIYNHCRVTSQTTIASFGYSYTLSVITVTGTSLVGDKVDYECDGV